MKKSLVWVVLLGAVLTLNSCGKDPEPVSPLVGTWSRVEYEFVEAPTGFSYWEGVKLSSWEESGYTIVFNADGTYSRNFTLPGQFNLTDKGTWTLDGSALKLSPEDPDDLDLIDLLESQYEIFPGLEFSVEGEIGEARVEMTRVASIHLPSDQSIDEAGEDPIPQEDYVPVDITVLYKFNKLN